MPRIEIPLEGAPLPPVTLELAAVYGWAWTYTGATDTIDLEGSALTLARPEVRVLLDVLRARKIYRVLWHGTARTAHWIDT
jgi:hypothetical protein